MISKEYKITGMVCASCAARIERKLNELPGIKAQVNFAMESAKVEFFSSLTTEKQILNELSSLGYQAKIKSNVSFSDKDLQTEVNKLKIRLIFSILLSVPLVAEMLFHIFGMHNFLSNRFFQLFLATIVQFYGGWPFYRMTFTLLKNKTAGMDTAIVLGTSAAYFLSLYNILCAPSKEVYFESSAVLITLVLLGKFLEKKTTGKTSESIKKLLALTPDTATLVIQKEKERETVQIKSEDIRTGQFLLVKPGEKIPVDGEIVEGNSVIDESMMTGESMPVEKQIGSKVFAGTINTTGAFIFRAEKVGKDTVLQNIIRLVSEAQNSKPPIQLLVDKISLYFVPVVIAIAVLTFIGWAAKTQNYTLAIINAISVLVIACPCTLGLATPTAIITGIGKASELGIFIRRPERLNIINKVNAVVFDKTGTITEGKLSISRIIPSRMDEKELLRLAAIAEKHSEHPIAKAILLKADSDIKTEIPEPIKFNVIPGKGVRVEIDEGTILLGTAQFLFENSITVENSDERKLSETSVYISFNNRFAGAIYLTDTIKKNTSAIIAGLNKAGYETYLISGDNQAATKSIAEQSGINNFKAGLLPENKVNFIKELKEKGHIIAMAGDGINDAPALTVSDISIAMGNGTDIAVEAGDIVITGGDISLIIESIKISKLIVKKIIQNLFWAFFYNLAAIPLAAFGYLSPIVAGTAMALSSISVVCNSLTIKKYVSTKHN